MLGQVLGELEVGVLIAGHDPVHHAGADQLGQVAVGGALGQRNIRAEDLGRVSGRSAPDRTSMMARREVVYRSADPDSRRETMAWRSSTGTGGS